MHGLLTCCLVLGASASPAAPIPGNTYGHELLLEVSHANPGLLAASISAKPPKGSEMVVIASTDPKAALARSDPGDLAASASASTVSAVSAAGDRLEVRDRKSVV